METMIAVKGLKKYFKEVKAVDDISFTVEKGELFGFLGVNGAGKSTTVNMLCTLFAPTAGEITISGCRLGKEDKKIRESIGVVWQGNCLDDRLTVKENLYVRGSLYGFDGAGLKEKVERVRDRLQLEEIYNRQYGKLSGGQKRRCELGAALINTPKVLFLDEPTTGLDPATRKLVWESLDRLRQEDGMTVFLTTHYMEEATRAGHIAIIDSGKIREFGTPFELKERYARDKLRLWPAPGKSKQVRSLLEQGASPGGISQEQSAGSTTLPGSISQEQDVVSVTLSGSMEALPILKGLEEHLAGFELVQGSMDDVFLNVTGKRLAEK
ncbi:MAG: ATP-binding cassette domain-containing protein [Firmicutes bacterium]|nr:ATP-binding cassette domain-containing protein [Bacillota bacterium]